MHQVINNVASDQLVPAVALVCYAMQNESHQIGFVSRHPITITPKGVPKIRPGEPLREQELRKIVAELSGRALAWIDPRVLASSIGHTVWWTPPSIRHVWWKSVKNKDVDYDALPMRTAAIPLPGFVFRAGHSSLAVFAVQGNARPRPDTPLFHAPFANVYDLGAVCMGSARIADDDWQAWEDAFFASVFTHDVGAINRIRGFKFAHQALESLAANPKVERFPEEWLRPANKDLTWFIEHGGAA